MVTVLGRFAEFDRILIRASTVRNCDIGKVHGVKLGC
jgi:hypothetical protein